MSHETPYDPSAPHDPLREWYSNTIWGKHLNDDTSLFEVMSLQVFQAGLTWKMILNKRDGFRAAFANWNIDTVAAMGPEDVDNLQNNPNIIRNRRKILATIENAGRIQELRSEHGGFCTWFYDSLPGNEYPNLLKELRGNFSFMGPEISRMWLMAAGRITREEGDKYRP